jgi:hypothetical protein
LGLALTLAAIDLLTDFALAIAVMLLLLALASCDCALMLSIFACHQNVSECEAVHSIRIGCCFLP